MTRPRTGSVFDELLEQLRNRAARRDTRSLPPEEALKAANQLGYPVLVRPSYVLGGQGMEIAYERPGYPTSIWASSPDRRRRSIPFWWINISMGKEIEVDAICDGEDVVIPGIMEHVERAGIHSGDSISVYPGRIAEPAGFSDTMIDIHRASWP